MVVEYLDIVRVPVFPAEADPPLVVDANTVLPRAIPSEFFQAIARRRTEILHLLRRVDDEKLAEHDLPELRRIPSHRLPGKEAPSVVISEALDHRI